MSVRGGACDLNCRITTISLDGRVKNKSLLREYYVLPCCLLLLNLCNAIISYKAATIRDGMLRTAFIIGMVLFGSSLAAFLIAPGIQATVRWLHGGSRQRGGVAGEVAFLAALGLLVFWLYFRVYTIGPGSILPADWRNGRH